MAGDTVKKPAPASKPQTAASLVTLVPAVVAGAFSLAVAAVLVAEYVSHRDDPFADPAELERLQAKVAESPGDAERKMAYRRAERQYREAFFERRHLADTGRWLLAGGLVLTLVCARTYVRLREVPRYPPLDAGSEEPDWFQVARQNAAGVAVIGVVVVAAFAAVGTFGPRGIGNARVTGEAAEEKKPLQANQVWPRFRGPDGQGVIPEGAWPTSWNEETGKNVLWKCAIPGQGYSSPVVWDDRVYLTTADVDERWMHCVDAQSGEVRWSTRVVWPAGRGEVQEDPVPEGFKDVTGYAAPTPVADGEGVYALYANADVACLDPGGGIRWVRNLGPVENIYGLASSPILHEDRLIVQIDQGTAPEDGLSFIVALDKRSGETVWDVDRPVASSWTTPIVIGPGGGLGREELITVGRPWVIAYNPADGSELWRARGMEGDVAPSPVFAGGLVFAASPSSQAMAIRAGGSGDVTDSRVAWTIWEGLPDTVSPLADETHYLQVESYGMVHCLRASTGEELWEHDFACSFKASPLRCGSRVYLTATDGRTFRFELADSFALQGTSRIDEEVSATPAFAGGRVYIRGKTHLYCIGSEDVARTVSVGPRAGVSGND